MPGVAAAQSDPIRVVITPSQSSFFAGEHFSVTITFTNTRTPEAGPSRLPEPTHPQTRTHKRGAHSISSAPLARPPTSPGTPRTALNPSPRKLAGFNDDSLPKRKGLIGTMRKGHQDGQLPELIEQRRKKLLAKSLSISISSQGLDEQLGEGIIAATPASAPFNKQAFSDTSHPPTSPHIPSPLSRTDTLSLSSNHPHARKQSVLDGQFALDVLSPTTSTPPQPYTPTTSLSLSTISEASFPNQSSVSSLTSPSTTRTSSPLSPSYSQPAFQPNGLNPNAVQAYPSVASTASSSTAGTTPRAHHNRRFSQQMQLGLGHPGNSQSQLRPSRTVFSSTFSQPSAEVILYSYAQFVGIAQLAQMDFGAVTPTQDQLYRMNRIRGALIRKRAAIGGGSMDISQSLHSSPGITSSLSGSASYYLNHQPALGTGFPRKKAGHGRSTSFSASLISLLSPVPGPSPQVIGERAMTTSPHLLNGSSPPVSGHGSTNGPGPGGGGGVGLGIVDPPGLGGGVVEDIDPDLPLPTFEAQPSMLAVDLSLAPGESRSYTYSIKLPDVLPPTYKGKALNFSYELVVGTCRAGSSNTTKPGSGPTGVNSISRVMKVPIRVYNYVTVDRAPRPYDILWPVLRNRLSGLGKGKEKDIPETQGKVVEETEGGSVTKIRKGARLSPKSSVQGSLEDLRLHINRLVISLPPLPTSEKETEGLECDDEGRSEASSSTTSLPPLGDGNVQGGLRMSLSEVKEQEEEDERVVGCREAVEILTRLPKKASYDVNKDGVKVAVLTFTKSAYRLGETVSGVVELNDRVGRARVLQLCAILEAHETLPTSVSPSSSARYLKRAYAEHHASFTLNTLRTTFALDIPSDASPAFQVNIDDGEVYPHFPSSGSSATSVSSSLGGLEWKVRLCLLVAIASDSSDHGTEGVYFKSLERDGPRGEWGSSWCAPKALAPYEKPRVGLHHLKAPEEKAKTKSWTQFFVDSVWNTIGGGYEGEEQQQGYDQDGNETDTEGGGGGGGEGNAYDGIKPDLAGGVGRGVDFTGGEDGWKEVKLETVECEVPIKVWPGNTAFRAVDVVFDV